MCRAAHAARYILRGRKAISATRIDLNSPDLDKACADAAEWLRAQAQLVPPVVAAIIALSLTMLLKVVSLKNGNIRLKKQICRALGLTPKSEQRGGAQKPLASDEPRGTKTKPLNPIERLRQTEDRHRKLSKWQRRCSRKNLQIANKARDKRKKLETMVNTEPENDSDDGDLSPQDLAELEAENLAAVERAKSGGGADPSMARQPETLMKGAGATLRHEKIVHPVDRDTLPKSAQVKKAFYEERVRFDFTMTLTRYAIDVEKLAINTRAGDTLVSADMDHFGPPKMLVAWNFLVTIAVLASQYVMPFNRLAKLTSSVNKHFTASEISRYYAWTAERFAAIYMFLGQSLAHAKILAGDDTPSLVLQVASAHEKMAGDVAHPSPWAHYADAKTAQSVEGPRKEKLAVRLACAFGFAAQRKNGAGEKVQFNTTTLSGRINASDPQSTVIFYRSHLGGLGNLLDAILPLRQPEDGGLIIQSDLSTVNLVSEGTVPVSCPIRLAGCSSHARRPFAIYEKQQPDMCDWILHAFKAIPIFENMAAFYGRNPTNVGAVRDIDQRQNWEFIRDQCAEMAQIWSRSTPLGEGARYILRHYEKLTLYLDHPELEPSNNFSERMLRQEKLIGNNSMFRQSIEGRCALDIMRTVLQTCVAADIDANAYCTWVMRQDQAIVSESPADFTPLAFKKITSAELNPP